jgi:hypothetical protein
VTVTVTSRPPAGSTVWLAAETICDFLRLDARESCFLLALQVVTTVVLHVLMARRYLRNT